MGPYGGRLASVTDRGQVSLLGYDGRGRGVGAARRLSNPGPPNDDPTTRYAPRWYIRATTFDGADRPISATTGSTTTELSGSNGQSVVTTSYSPRGGLAAVAGSYGSLVTSVTRSPEGMPTQTVFGDVAPTTRYRTYDTNLRLSSVQTLRGPPSLWTSPTGSYVPPGSSDPPTLQTLLEDADFAYDRVGNLTSIRDWRLPQEWPAGAEPVSRTVAYDDAYRVTQVQYSYPNGSDSWASPFAPEDAQPALEQPVPHVAFANRVLTERFSYDWLGNTSSSDDDAHGFYDRSLGTITNGSPLAGPYQLQSASNQALGGSATGQLAAGYDAAGELTGLIVARAGACLPAAASCWQRYFYDWDERGRLTTARRWDLAPGTLPALSDPIPDAPPDVRLDYAYDAHGTRVRKTATDAQGNQLHDVYVFTSLELRRATFGTDYELDAATESVYLLAGGQRVGRVFYAPQALPTVSGGQQHVLLLLGGYLGLTGDRHRPRHERAGRARDVLGLWRHGQRLPPGALGRQPRTLPLHWQGGRHRGRPDVFRPALLRGRARPVGKPRSRGASSRDRRPEPLCVRGRPHAQWDGSERALRGAYLHCRGRRWSRNRSDDGHRPSDGQRRSLSGVRLG